MEIWSGNQGITASCVFVDSLITVFCFCDNLDFHISTFVCRFSPQGSGSAAKKCIACATSCPDLTNYLCDCQLEKKKGYRVVLVDLQSHTSPQAGSVVRRPPLEPSDFPLLKRKKKSWRFDVHICLIEQAVRTKRRSIVDFNKTLFTGLAVFNLMATGEERVWERAW